MPNNIQKLRFSDYLNVNALSKSGMSKILQSPSKFKREKDNPTPPTDAMIFGSCYHTAVLEPGKIDDRVAVQPAEIKQRRGKAWEAFQAENEDKIILTQSDWADIRGMVSVFDLPHHSVAKILVDAEGPVELSFFWHDKTYDVPLKARPDKLSVNFDARGNAVVDLKKTVDASPQGFWRQCKRYGYDIQAALYLDMVTWITGQLHSRFIFIAQEAKAPYDIGVYEAPEQMIHDGREKYQRAIEIYADCQKSDVWPGYSNAINEMFWPEPRIYNQ